MCLALALFVYKLAAAAGLEKPQCRGLNLRARRADTAGRRYNRCPPLAYITSSAAVSVEAWRPSVEPMSRMREPCRRLADYSSALRRSAANELGPPDALRWAVHAER